MSPDGVVFGRLTNVASITACTIEFVYYMGHKRLGNLTFSITILSYLKWNKYNPYINIMAIVLKKIFYFLPSYVRIISNKRKFVISWLLSDCLSCIGIRRHISMAILSKHLVNDIFGKTVFCKTLEI